MSSTYVRGNAVTWSVWPRSSIEDSFSSIIPLYLIVQLHAADPLMYQRWLHAVSLLAGGRSGSVIFGTSHGDVGSDAVAKTTGS